MHFIGDVHGKWKAYHRLIKDLDESIQVGDFGFGFPGSQPTFVWNMKHRFIRGNHDDPATCRRSPNYLGDYGVTKEGIFFVSGGFSVDQQHRTIGVSWWPDEELPVRDYEYVLNAYTKARPEIVVAHTCPARVADKLIGSHANFKREFKNRTEDDLMEQMIEAHSPRLWVHGHFHTFEINRLNGCKFVCLNELQVWRDE